MTVRRVRVSSSSDLSPREKFSWLGSCITFPHVSGMGNLTLFPSAAAPHNLWMLSFDLSPTFAPTLSSTPGGGNVDGVRIDGSWTVEWIQHEAVHARTCTRSQTRGLPPSPSLAVDPNGGLGDPANWGGARRARRQPANGIVRNITHRAGASLALPTAGSGTGNWEGARGGEE